MFNPNKITKILGATFILVSSNSVLAATVPAATATVTVQNAFTLTQDSGLDFGIIRATADVTANGAVAVLTLGADSSVSAADNNLAKIAPLSGGAAAVFSVSGAAPFTDLKIDFPASVTLSGAALPASAAKFTIDNFAGTVVGGLNDATPVVDGDTMQTDSTGAVALNVGADLSTDARAATITQNYQDVAYTGTYIMTVTY